MRFHTDLGRCVGARVASMDMKAVGIFSIARAIQVSLDVVAEDGGISCEDRREGGSRRESHKKQRCRHPKTRDTETRRTGTQRHLS